MNNWYYNDNGDNLGETSWDSFEPDIMESLGYVWEDYNGWITEGDN